MKLTERLKERIIIGRMERLLSGSPEGLAGLAEVAAGLPRPRPDLENVLRSIGTGYRDETQLTWFLMRSGWKLNSRCKRTLLRRLFLPRERPAPEGSAGGTEIRYSSAGVVERFMEAGIPRTPEAAMAVRRISRENPDVFFFFGLPSEFPDRNIRGVVRAAKGGNVGVLFPLERLSDLDRLAGKTSELNFRGIPFGFFHPLAAEDHREVTGAACMERLASCGAMFYFLGFSRDDLPLYPPETFDRLSAIAARFPLLVAELMFPRREELRAFLDGPSLRFALETGSQNFVQGR